MRACEILTEAKRRVAEPTYSERLLAVTESPAFKAWFGNSQVVDPEGRPLICFHAAWAGDIQSFDVGKQRFGRGGYGFYFTNAAGANRYAEYHMNFLQIARQPSLIPVFLKIENPLRIESLDQYNTGYYLGNRGRPIDRYIDQRQDFGAVRGYGRNMPADKPARAEREGFDGIITSETLSPILSPKNGLKHLDHGSPRGKQYPVFVVFRSNQIKSIFNKAFDPGQNGISEATA